MTFCLVKVEMEDDSDIYSDLPVYNFDDEIEKLKASNKNLNVEIAHLQEELLKITKEKDEYQTRCATLTKNISSLLKTAQAEIQRKDKLIKELRDQITEITLETKSYRKRKIERDLEAGEAPVIKSSSNGVIEEQNSVRKDSFSSVYKENGSIASEKNPVSSCNDTSKQHASAINTEIGLLRQTTQRLPFANVHCKTIYSQRMLNKLQTPSTTNKSSDVQSKSINEKEINDNDKITQRNGFYESAVVKKTAMDNTKGNEDEKFVDSGIKGDVASASPFLVPEVNGIHKLRDKKQSEANLEPRNNECMSSMKSKQLEALFGSPLKWTESSTTDETLPQLASTSATVYEDSCSAHIENAKFTLDLNKPCLPKPLSIHKDSIQKIAPINKSACLVQRQELNGNVCDKEKPISNENKWIRAFENVSNKAINKPKSVFSPLRKDVGKLSSISVNINKECSVDIPHNFLLKSKYEDSVLGQFDDTTQFVSALTKIESKISPLNTPVKCSSQPISVNICTPSVKSNSLKEVEQLSKPGNSNQITNSNCRPVNKDIHEKPINILQPRKTPRIVSYNKTKESDKKTCRAVPETPTKSNRFAINEEFISKQEEKVLKNSFQHRSHLPSQEISSKEHASEQRSSSTYINQTSDGTSSNYFQNPREKQSKRKMIDRLSSPEINPIKLSKRCEEKQQISSDEAKPNLCQDSIRKKFNVLPNNLEKRVSRIQNFKPSSHLKKQSDTYLSKEKCYQNKEKKEIDDDHKSPKNCKSYGGNCISIESSPVMKIEKAPTTTDDHGKDITKNLEKLPTIVRSSKKPEFASTTLSDDDYASKTPTKPLETLSKSRNSEVIELMEWVLKPITFHSDHKVVKKQSYQGTTTEIQSSSNKSNLKDKSQITCSDSVSPNMPNSKTDSFVSHTCPSQVKLVNSAPSPNKVIPGRRPLNFGVSVVTH